MNLKNAKELAESKFKRKEIQARESVQAWKDYESQRIAVREKTARLKALRLAKEAADKQAVTKKALAG